MGKGDDAVLKKKNRRRRKKMRASESVPARIASIMASKRRRKTGKRRICEAMCFSLPTPEDPFNDRNDPRAKKNKVSILKKGKHKQKLKELITQKRENTELFSNKHYEVAEKKLKDNSDGSTKGCPSKFICVCLNSIQSAWAEEGLSDDCTSELLLANKWGFNFWKCYSGGSDILDVSGVCASREQMAWVISVASDALVRKEKDGLVVPSPFLLFLVDSREEAAKVKSACKPLKEFGVHTVSIHSGAALAHQVHGLKFCEPEFVVSTPERLLDLILLKAIDISGVSFLVLDGPSNFFLSGFEHKIKPIRECISGSPRTIVFGGSCGQADIGLVETLTRRPVCRLSIQESNKSTG